MKTISAYKIWWIEFIPEKGYVTKHDRKAFGDILLLGRRRKTFRKWFPSKELAEKYLREFSGKLDKHYTCYLFTDKQFSMAREDEGFAIPYTKKQKENPYYI